MKKLQHRVPSQRLAIGPHPLVAYALLVLFSITACSRAARGPIVFTRNRLNHIEVALTPAPLKYEGGGDLAGDPSACRLRDGNCLIAGRAADGQLWISVWFQNRWKFSPWIRGNAIITANPALAVAGDNRAIAVVRSPWSSYLWTWVDSNGHAANWQDLGGVLSSAPTVASCPDETFVIAGIDNHQALWWMRLGSGGEVRHPWQAAGGVLDGGMTLLCGPSGATLVARGAGGSINLGRAGFDRSWVWEHGGITTSREVSAALGPRGVTVIFVDANSVLYRNRFPEHALGRWEGQWQTLSYGVETAVPGVWENDLYIFLRGPDQLVRWWRESRPVVTTPIWGVGSLGKLAAVPTQLP